MNVFFTADLHLGHDNIRRHCHRPFGTVEEMDEAIIANWNGAVASKDLVYIVGDFAWRNHGHHLARLKGKLEDRTRGARPWSFPLSANGAD